MTGSAAAVRDDVIAEDVPCRACGYNLRGLAGRGGRCPECAEGVAGSVAAFEARRKSRELLPLESSAPGWVSRVWRGCTLTLGGGAVYLLVMAVTLAVVKNLPKWQGTGMVATLVSVLWSLRVAGLYGATLLIASGLWLVVSPEPEMPRGAAERWAIRAGLILLCLLRGTWFYGVFNGSDLFDSDLLLFCDRVVTSAVTWGGLRVIARLAHRGECPRLSRGATVLAWAILVGTIAQGMWLRWFEITTGLSWMAPPEPMYGPLATVALLPFAQLFWPRVDDEVVAWTLLAGLAVASGVVQAGVWRRLYWAKKRKTVENL